jgi:hypothetical protein
MKTPNTKQQTPKKLQTSNSGIRCMDFNGETFEYWCLPDVWCLVFGV